MRRIVKIRVVNHKILFIGILSSYDAERAHRSFLGIVDVPAISPDRRDPHKRCKILGEEQTVVADEFRQASRDFSAVKLTY